MRRDSINGPDRIRERAGIDTETVHQITLAFAGLPGHWRIGMIVNDRPYVMPGELARTIGAELIARADELDALVAGVEHPSVAAMLSALRKRTHAARCLFCQRTDGTLYRLGNGSYMHEVCNEGGQGAL